MSYFKKICLVTLILLHPFVVYAEDALSQWKEVQLFIDDMVENHKFDRKKLTAVLNEAKFQPKIIEAMDRPYEKKSWDAYKGLFLTKNRINEGVSFWHENQKTLTEVEKKYGVPADIIVAIIGVETLYGKHKGKYRVLDSLTTLAFNYPKRSKFFTKELREYLLLCREQNVPATKYYGSYAGAIGIPQFMPSSYRFYAIDSQGKKGQADLMNKNQDVIYSVANYFVKNGWKNTAEVAEIAKVSGDAYKNLSINTRAPGYTFTDILSSGVKPALSRMKHPSKAGLIELETKSGQEYWLAYSNFYVITHYNRSPQYALVVHLLSEKLKENNHTSS
ncbi:MAG: lytic murein transglycosylase B [Legionellaceae bacterium]|nr:lytic murein transglycosylase B [Legionellaceae bacterium]